MFGGVIIRYQYVGTVTQMRMSSDKHLAGLS